MKYTACLDCEKRHFGCHSKCEEYAQYKRHMEILKEHREKTKFFTSHKRGKYKHWAY